MPTFIPPVRDYKFSDARLVEIGLEKIAFAQRDAAELLTVGIDAAWITDLNNQILAFGALPNDEVELGEQMEATEDKDVDIEQVKDKLKELRSAVARAFGEKSNEYKQFNFQGLDKFTDAQVLKQSLVVQGLNVTYAVQLATKGWDAADNTELQTLTNEVVASLQNQSIETGSRDNAQEARVLAGNAVYNLLQNELCEAGRAYWRTRSAAKYNDYIIYDTPSGGPTPNVTVSGILTDNVTNNPIAGAQFVMGPHTFTSGADGSFSKSFFIETATTYNITITATGYETVNSTVQFTPNVNVEQDLQMTPDVSVGSLSGTVSDAGTAMGISGALINITAPGFSMNTNADANGNYSLGGIPAGSYTVTANAPGYIGQSVGVTISANFNTIQNFSLVVVP
jgi:hypothetical protein